MIRKPSIPITSWDDDILLAGRIVRSEIRFGDRLLIIYNMHIYKVPPDVLSRTVAAICQDFHRASNDPQHISVFFFGDFNYRHPADRIFKHDGLHYTPGNPEIVKVPGHLMPLHRALSKFVHMYVDQPTHYDHKNLTETAIDRVYSSFSSYILRLLHIQGKVHRTAFDNWKRGVSDHAAVIVSVSPRPPLHHSQRPIPSWITRSPAFRIHFEQLDSNSSADTDSFKSLATFKSNIRKAAQLTRDSFHATDNRGLANDMLYTTISRALYYQNFALARILWKKHSLARTHLTKLNGRLYLRYPAKFAEEAALARKHSLSIEQSSLEAQLTSKNSADDSSIKRIPS